MGWIGIPIWNKSSGGIETINKPGTYYLHCTISVPKSGVLSPMGKTFTVLGWQIQCTDVQDDSSGGSTITVKVGSAQPATVNESELSPLQISAIIGIGLFAAFALFIDRVEKASPMLSLLIYGAIALALIIGYKKFVAKK